MFRSSHVALACNHRTAPDTATQAAPTAPGYRFSIRRGCCGVRNASALKADGRCSRGSRRGNFGLVAVGPRHALPRPRGRRTTRLRPTRFDLSSAKNRRKGKTAVRRDVQIHLQILAKTRYSRSTTRWREDGASSVYHMFNRTWLSPLRTQMANKRLFRYMGKRCRLLLLDTNLTSEVREQLLLWAADFNVYARSNRSAGAKQKRS
jgi:hypothetical protein